jgi:hypothetical protein
MKKNLIVALSALAAIGLFATSALADPDGGTSASGVTDPAVSALIGNDDLFATIDLSALLDPPPGMGTPTQHFGPYPSDSTDSGTCGDDWATDYFDRHFTVRTSATGMITVVEQFKNGSFVTNPPPPHASPGACDNSDGTPPGTVDSGIVGSMHGYFIIPVPFQQSSYDQSCVAEMPNAPCTTAGFIDSHFLGCAYPAMPCAVSTFFFHYAAGDQGLVVHEWKNASCDRGGNQGDIASLNFGVTPPFLQTVCP